jgi:hypothetical protein
MRNDDTALVHGSFNVFRDLGNANPEAEQPRAILAAKIIGVLDRGAHRPLSRSSTPRGAAALRRASWRRTPACGNPYEDSAVVSCLLHGHRIKDCVYKLREPRPRSGDAIL